MTQGDPSAFQAWLIAIPTGITALSTWYLNRKSVKTHEKSNAITHQAISESADEVAEKLESLEARIAILEESVEKTRACMITLAQKYTDTINSLQTARQSSAVPSTTQAPGSSQTQSSPAPAKPNVTVVETKQTPVGKVTWKK